MIIQTEHVSYTYGAGTPFQKAALHDVNITIESGEFVGIIGHTGSGKSTLMRHLNGLERPQEGRVLLDGKDMWENPKEIRKVRFQIGLVFQYPEHQLFEETVYKDIAFGPHNMGLSDDEIKKRVLEAMEFVGLSPELAGKSPFELSGGQKRRVAIAGVFAMEPKVLILDEPTAGLDPKGRDELLLNIKAYHKAKGTTVVLVSHSMEDIARVAGRIIVLNQSRVAMEGTPEEIFARAAELQTMGLDVPQVTRVFDLLKQRGITFEDGVYTVDYAKKLILERLGRGSAV